jgi:putative transposase
VARAEDWRWGSLWRRQRGDAEAQSMLHAWPVALPANWVEWVNAPHTEAELQAVRRSVQRGSPFGSEAWCKRTAQRLGLQSSLRPRGRPRKKPDEGSPTLFSLQGWPQQ